MRSRLDPVCNELNGSGQHATRVGPSRIFVSMRRPCCDGHSLRPIQNGKVRFWEPMSNLNGVEAVLAPWNGMLVCNVVRVHGYQDVRRGHLRGLDSGL